MCPPCNVLVQRTTTHGDKETATTQHGRYDMASTTQNDKGHPDYQLTEKTHEYLGLARINVRASSFVANAYAQAVMYIRAHI